MVFPAERRASAPIVTPEVDSARGHETILVVDDEPGLRALAKSGLRQRGFDVLAVESGEQALEILRAGEPRVDMVVLDLTMPGLSGEKVLRAIRGFRPQPAGADRERLRHGAEPVGVGQPPARWASSPSRTGSAIWPASCARCSTDRTAGVAG